jgi:hypothetical protein
MGSWWALNSSRNESSWMRWPRGSGSGMPSPLRNTPMLVVWAAFQSSSDISVPSDFSHTMSGVPRRGRPWNQRRRRKTGWEFRSPISAFVYPSRSSSMVAQSNQETSLSWQ